MASLFFYWVAWARPLSVPFVPPLRSLFSNIAAAIVVATVTVLNAKVFLRIAVRMRPPGWVRNNVFKLAFGAILVLAVLCRVVWTRSVLFPATTPDGYTYLLPALEHPKLPLDEARPLSFPYLIALSLAVFGHPIGILIVQNLLAILSAALLAFAVKKRLGMPIVSLLLLFYMLFCSKNVAFEYLLLTEHLSRCLFAVVIAVLLLRSAKPGPATAALLAILSIASILTKPNALALIPGILAGLMITRWSARQPWRRIATSALVYVAIVTGSIAAYMTLQFERFGSFQITSMTGYALYWNVNLLTDLDGPAHPDVKRELRKFFPVYLAKYGSRNKNLGNWAVFGSRTPETERDFGEQSPGAVVRAYAQTHGNGSLFHRIDRVFMDLALEGICAHPWRYLAMSIRSTAALLWDGLTFSYSLKPIEDTDVATRAEFFRLWSIVGHAKSGHLVVPAGFRPVDPRSPVIRLPELVGRIFAILFLPFAIASIGLVVSGASAVGVSAHDRDRLLRMVPATVTVLSYLLLCGFILPGEHPRFLMPIQDLVVMLGLALFGVGWRAIRPLIWSEESRANIGPSFGAGRSVSRGRP